MEHHGSPWNAPEKKPSISCAPSATSNVTSPSSLPALAAAAVKAALTTSPSKSPALNSFTFSPNDTLPTPPSSASVASFDPKATTLSPPRPSPMVRRSSCDLFECIEQHSRLPEDKAKYVFAQVVEAVYYLGKMGICHRDLKDENIACDADYRVKLIDFGSAVLFDPRKPLPYYNR